MRHELKMNETFNERYIYIIYFTNFTPFILRYQCFKIPVKVSAIFRGQIMNNHTTEITQASIEINGNLHFCQNRDGETS